MIDISEVPPRPKRQQISWPEIKELVRGSRCYDNDLLVSYLRHCASRDDGLHSLAVLCDNHPEMFNRKKA